MPTPSIAINNDINIPEVLQVLYDIKDFLEQDAQTGQKSILASKPVAIAVDGASLPVSIPDASVVGTISQVNQSIQITTAGQSVLSIQTTGIFSAILTPQVSLDATNWVSINVNNSISDVGGSGSQNTITSNSVYSMSVAGFAYFRLLCTTYNSGVINIILRTSQATGTNDAIIVIPGTSSTGSSLSTSQNTGMTTAIVKNSPGNLYGLIVNNLAAAVTYIQFFNSISTPSLGASVVFAIPFAVGAAGDVMLPFPINFSTGIAVGAATTAGGAVAPITAPDVLFLYK